MTTTNGIGFSSRRTFLKTAAFGGAALIIRFDRLGLIAAETSGVANQFSLNSWIRVDADSTVTLTIGKSEMGQGVRTSLAMLLAEELEADWSRIKLIQAKPFEGSDLGTGGSD